MDIGCKLAGVQAQQYQCGWSTVSKETEDEAMKLVGNRFLGLFSLNYYEVFTQEMGNY